MNLLLMSCKSEFLDNSKIYPPLGLLYLKSYINKYSPDTIVKLMDVYNLNNPKIFEPFDLIGVSISTPQRIEALNILKTIKDAYPEKKVIAGGPHIRHYLDDMIKTDFDYLVPLDGEKAIVEILNGTDKRILSSTLTREEIATAPRPDRMSKESKFLVSTYEYKVNGKEITTMLTARGCPMSCGFCEESGTQVRWSSMENIIGELDDIKRRGYKGVYLFDDLLMASIKKAKPILEELKKRDLIFRCNGHAKYFNDEMAQLLSDSGCYEIMFGAESGSQKILDTVNKKTTVEQNYKFVELCNKYKIPCKAFMMIGLPGEDWESLKDTERFISTSGMKDFQLAIYFPYKGTIIRDNIKDYDLIIENEGLGAYGQKGGKTESTVRTNALSSKDLLDFRDYIVRKYKPESHKEMNK